MIAISGSLYLGSRLVTGSSWISSPARTSTDAGVFSSNFPLELKSRFINSINILMVFNVLKQKDKAAQITPSPSIDKAFGARTPRIPGEKRPVLVEMTPKCPYTKKATLERMALPNNRQDYFFNSLRTFFRVSSVALSNRRVISRLSSVDSHTLSSFATASSATSIYGRM